ncbi:hypothetical protein [Andreprevotia sp. IGB-42]|uniref:hypothetical protein n=1 Tax=Andreprevotia sp. IGB-42 TaxID=2497473 RepID=UPI00135C8B6E|nr:hypothetical protein [Andreprevotia sp. IGB-42]
MFAPAHAGVCTDGFRGSNEDWRQIGPRLLPPCAVRHRWMVAGESLHLDDTTGYKARIKKRFSAVGFQAKNDALAVSS